VVRKYLGNHGISIITRKQNNKQHKIANSKAVSPEFSIKVSLKKKKREGRFKITVVDELTTVFLQADDMMTALISM